MKTVYIIIPVFNGEKYIKRCIDNILSQTYKNFNIIVVNDGSTDNTLEIIESYNGKGIKIINQENKGVSVARNAALDYVIGLNDDSYITFIDADDYIDVDYIQYLVNKIEDNNVDISCCSFLYQTSTNSHPHNQIDKDIIFTCFDGTKTLIEDRTIQSHSVCKMFKTKLWSDIRYPVGVGWMEDQATIFKAFYNAKKGIFVSNYCGYHYWQEGESACRSKMSNKRVIDSLIGYMEPLEFDYYDYSFSD